MYKIKGYFKGEVWGNPQNQNRDPYRLRCWTDEKN